MGKLNQPHALVVMTNGDVYYLSIKESERLEQLMMHRIEVFKSVDIRSNATLRLHIHNISSVVEGNQHAER